MALTYSVKQLADAAGISVRTLHIYDRMHLLKPQHRGPNNYRVYGDAELLRLQQILFYRELDVPLKEIAQILERPGFDLQRALLRHREQLVLRKARLELLLQTIDNTIIKLKNKTMLNTDELYNGLPKSTAEAYRKEAADKYGEEKLVNAENYLNKLSKEEIGQLSARQKLVTVQLANMKHKDPHDGAVQLLIQEHYDVIRHFWGTVNNADKQAEAYKGLGKLYTQDERFTAENGKPRPKFAAFLCEAMAYFADTQLK